MIEKNWPEDGYIAYCDGCSMDYEDDAEEFMEIVAAIKAAGWLIKKEGGEWAHYCQECRKNV